jgi:molecular chaperone GrpE (heat shock protein)
MSEELCEVDCPSCGIAFKFSKKIEEMWRNTEKQFFCPNGHSLHWNKPTETAEQKELKTLRADVKELKSKLESALKDVETQKKRADDLQVELEIYKPATMTDDNETVTIQGRGI